MNASSTLAAVLADVSMNIKPCSRANASPSSFFTSLLASRSLKSVQITEIENCVYKTTWSHLNFLSHLCYCIPYVTIEHDTSVVVILISFGYHVYRDTGYLTYDSKYMMTCKLHSRYTVKMTAASTKVATPWVIVIQVVKAKVPFPTAHSRRGEISTMDTVAAIWLSTLLLQPLLIQSFILMLLCIVL